MAAGAETLKRTPLYDRHVAAGARLEAAVRLANRAAGIVVGKLGTAAVRHQELFGAR